MALPALPPNIMKFYFRNRINESLQIGDGIITGDDVYYCPTATHGGFRTVDNANINTTGIVRIGKATSVNNIVTIVPGGIQYELIVRTDPSFSAGVVGPIVSGYNQATDFIMFSKNTQANRSSLVGYFAEVTLANDSPDPAELFGVSTEASESSK